MIHCCPRLCCYTDILQPYCVKNKYFRKRPFLYPILLYKKIKYIFTGNANNHFYPKYYHMIFGYFMGLSLKHNRYRKPADETKKVRLWAKSLHAVKPSYHKVCICQDSKRLLLFAHVFIITYINERLQGLFKRACDAYATIHAIFV